MLPLYSIHCCRPSDISALGQSGIQDTHLVRDMAGVRTEQLFNHTEETNPAFCNFLCVAGGRRQEEHQEKGLGPMFQVRKLLETMRKCTVRTDCRDGDC